MSKHLFSCWKIVSAFHTPNLPWTLSWLTLDLPWTSPGLAGDFTLDLPILCLTLDLPWTCRWELHSCLLGLENSHVLILYPKAVAAAKKRVAASPLCANLLTPPTWRDNLSTYLPIPEDKCQAILTLERDNMVSHLWDWTSTTASPWESLLTTPWIVRYKTLIRIRFTLARLSA